MKKYLLGIFVAFIGIGLSAFVGKSPSPKPIKASTVETAYYWYPLQTNGKIAGDVLNGGVPDVKSNVIEGGSNALTSCSDESMIECLGGCTNPNLHFNDDADVPSGTLDNRIREDN